MKKQYMKPLVEVVKINVQQMIAGSNPPEWNGEAGSRENSISDDEGTNSRHYDAWGDWEEEE